MAGRMVRPVKEGCTRGSERQRVGRTPVHKYQLPVKGSEMAGALLDWYTERLRDLPWRRTRDPYHIWVSEIMLQQTRVETVIPYYRRWIEQFPTLTALAEAPQERVLKAWEGLGYYARARNLHMAARAVTEQFGGQVPDDPASVLGLPGVGPYTAGAILSLAFGRPEPAVDGNVMRVLSRLFLIRDEITRPATRQAMESLIREWIPEERPAEFNQALMELGALICKPTSPQCDHCPLVGHCVARAQGCQAALPVKAKARAPRPVQVVAGVIWHQERFLLVRRPPDGLLGGLWEFPGGERPAALSWERALHLLLLERCGIRLEIEAHLCSIRHVFSHLTWDLRAYTARLADSSALPAEGAELRWVSPDALGAFALPVAQQKVLAHALVVPRPQEG